MNSEYQKFESHGQSQMRVVGKVDGTANLGDQYTTYAAREIYVSGVGEHPPNYPDYWVDRPAYQTQLHNCLTSATVTQIVALGGFGKSFLAAWGYDHFQNFVPAFEKRVWVSLRRELPFERFARYVLQELGWPVTDPQANEERLLRELVLRLHDPNQPVRMLVVIDQAESAIARSEWDWYGQFLQAWARQGQGSAVLATSRSSVLAGTTIELGGLSEAEGITLFDHLNVTGAQRSALVTLTKGHPLKLNLCARWTTQTYGARVDERAIDFFTKLFAHYQGDPEAGVEAIFAVIFAALPIALQDLLVKLSVYRLPFDEPMAQMMQTEMRSLEGELFHKFQLDLKSPLLELTKISLKTLNDRGLLLSQGDRYVLHPLVEQLVRSRLTEEHCQVAHEQAISFYTAHYQPWDGTIASCREELEAFYHACELGQYPQAYGMLNRCVELLDRAGYWRILLPLYQRLTNEWQAANDEEAQNLGWAWTRLGNLHHSLGNYPQAIAHHEQARAIFNQLGYQLGIAAALANLGNAYQSLGQYQRAIEFYQQSLDIERDIGDRGGEANAFNNLGNAYSSLGQYQRAIEFHQQSLDIERDIGDRGGEANSLWSLACIYQQRGRLRMAMRYRHQVYQVWQDTHLPIAAAPFLTWQKNLIQSLGNNWAEKLIANEKAMAWFNFLIGYLFFSLRLVFSPLAHLQQRLKIPPLYFWFAVVLAVAILVWLLKR